uniref:Uncharacterized protein n=1 Tax=Roseihalotalea indica TaxID=2867963 RepID=A0AA49GLU6_9BACT|nr:hypothetical protein K4G66_19570 [Tunicatimonas sp. TK19036]
MELLTTSTSAYLLQASLDVLHYESREWQEEITFAMDEMMFLHRLHRRFGEKSLPELIQKQSIALQTKLLLLSQQILTMQETIREHESYLSEIIQRNINVSDDEYRNSHKRVKLQMESLLKEVKQSKKEMFQWVEDILS